MKQVTVPIKGMHCRSCEITLTDSLEKLAGVKKADVSLKTKSATLHGKTLPSVAVIEKIVEAAGYEVGYEKKPWFSKNWPVYRDVVIGIAVVSLLWLLIGFSGFTDIVGTGNLNSDGIFFALVIGLTAGLSTCMALVGGLVLGLSAKYAESHPNATTSQKFKPHIYFNIGRIAAFFVLGGTIGLLGSVLQIKGSLLGVLTVAVGVVMLVLGLQLTGLFPKLSNISFTLPSGLAKRLGLNRRRDQQYSRTNAAVLGALSFFLPCGFTQAMQLYAVSTGSFVTGSLVMGLFAIGTMPGLLGVGGLASVVTGDGAKRFFRVVGVAVVVMAFVNISNGYNLTGWRSFSLPSFRSDESTTNSSTNNAVSNSSEYVLKAKYAVASGMMPKIFTIQANTSYVLEVEALEDGVGCMSTVMIPRFNNTIEYLTKGKTNVLPFKTGSPGTYKITCAMGVPHATLNVVEG